MQKVLTFVGNGKMALALAQGLKATYAIEVAGRDPQKLAQFEAALGVEVKQHGLDDFDIADKTILLCVKPANIISVGEKLKGEAEALYSVLAGTPLSVLQSQVQARATVRAMPNLAATLGQSMTTLTGDASLKEEATALFGAIGQTLWMGSEKELDIATALAGSGPAYLALIAEALCDGAVNQGLRRDDAMALMRGLFAGFGELIAQEHPALLKEAVMSPGGTTAAGIAALEAQGVRKGCMDAIDAAYKRALSLSR